MKATIAVGTGSGQKTLTLWEAAEIATIVRAFMDYKNGLSHIGEWRFHAVDTKDWDVGNSSVSWTFSLKHVKRITIEGDD